jgi:hypothetical protein
LALRSFSAAQLNGLGLDAQLDPLPIASSIIAALIMLITAAYPVSIRSLLRLWFAAIHGFSGHVARVVMIPPRLLFARLLLVWILVVGHVILL